MRRTTCFVDLDAERQRDLLGNAGTGPVGITPFHGNDGVDEFLLRSLRARICLKLPLNWRKILQKQIEGGVLTVGLLSYFDLNNHVVQQPEDPGLTTLRVGSLPPLDMAYASKSAPAKQSPHDWRERWLNSTLGTGKKLTPEEAKDLRLTIKSDGAFFPEPPKQSPVVSPPPESQEAAVHDAS